MKMISLILIMASLLNSRAACAAPDLGDLAEQEAKWKRTEVILPGVKEPAQAWLTEQRKLRLDQLPELYNVELTIKGSDGIMRDANIQSIVKACESSRALLEFEIEEQHAFEFEAFVNPLNAEGRARLDNKIITVEVVPSLGYLDKSQPYSTSARLKKFEGDLIKLFASSQASIMKTGKVAWTWYGADDVVCDLVSQQAAIAGSLRVQFEAARLRRHEVISADTVQRLSEGLLKTAAAALDQSTRSYFLAAHLGVLLSEQLGAGFSEFMSRKFAQLLPRLIALNQGVAIPSNPTLAEQTARALDDLSQGKDINSARLKTNIVIDDSFF